MKYICFWPVFIVAFGNSFICKIDHHSEHLKMRMSTKNQKALEAAPQPQYFEALLQHYEKFEMPIEAAGLAAITRIELVTSDQIRLEYQYEADSESRSGYMLLKPEYHHKYNGNWHTRATNGNSYQGTLYFVFSFKGEAKGEYQFAGNDYSIEIKLKSHE